MKKKSSAILLSLSMLLGMVTQIPVLVTTAKEEFPQTEPASISGTAEQEPDETAVKHAYDPIAEYEAEKSYRESTNYVQNKLIFSVLDIRRNGARPAYLTDKSELCRSYGFKNVSMVYESVRETVQTDDGFTAYEVFYEAAVEDDDVWSLVDKAKADEAFCSVEPDFIWSKTDVGGYSEVSAEEMAKETHFDSLDVPNLWGDLHNDNIIPGNNVVVAVIDTGVDYNHEDLHDAMWVNKGEIPGNQIDDDGNGYVDDVYGYDFVENDGDPMDDHGHGTHVAGIIAMQPNNKGGVGLAYGAKIMAVKAGQSTGYFASTDIAKAIRYAVNNGADVINMSFGGAGRSTLVEAALKDAFATTVLVGAAGNNGWPTTDGPFPHIDIYPAGYSYVLGVMATYDNGYMASFSNWDYIIGENCEYELCAPGVNIYSSLPNNRYAYWSGTSMAAPNVAAAAAIIRSVHPDKSKYTSRYIMGQLVSATRDKCGSYPLLNIKDSLLYQPKPRLKFNEIYLFDTENISEANNNDGIVQAGETIDVGVNLFNYWGTATDVTVTADAISPGGVPNPHVEWINDTVSIPDIGTFATSSNGFVYDDIKLTGVTSPLRFRIKEGTPNDVQIAINLHFTAKNGMDKNDKTVYYNNFPYEETPYTYIFIVQNGETLSGVIHEDMTLTADKYWILENNVLIPDGVTVTVEPGTQIQFWSADPSNPYGHDREVFLNIEGIFICEGTENNPIEIFPGKNTNKPIIIRCSGPSNRYLSLKYVNFLNVQVLYAESISHCNFVWDNVDNLLINPFDTIDLSKLPYYHISAETLKYSNFYNFVSYSNYLQIDTYIDLTTHPEITGDYYTLHDNSFKNISTLRFYLTSNINRMRNNVISNCNMYNSKNKPLHSTSEYDYTDPDTYIKNNAFLFIPTQRFSNSLICFTATEGKSTYDISGNYWGTTDPQLVKLQCYDADWNVSLNDLIQEPYLTLDDDMSDIYPFMTEAYLTDSDGRRIQTAYAGQTVTMHVKFNRDMAQDIQPMVTYGGAMPYTDYLVNGGWSTMREWTAELKIDPFIDLGKMYIRVKDAVADDDRWLRTGTDEARFFFNIEKSSAQAMALQGTGSSGSNELTWMQDDYETLAGYNIYRSTSYDNTQPVTEQNFRKINRSLISDNECAYSDTDVEQGVKYYYYFTVVDTAFKESPASNVIMCTPTDTEKPVITHTPLKAAITGEQIAITADITDNVKITSAMLYYRDSGAESYKSTAMRKLEGSDKYRAVISSYEVGTTPIEYYIFSSDGTNEAYKGTPESPLTISIADGHNYDAGRITKQPTCTEEGEMFYTCLDCGSVRTESIPKAEHVYNGGVIAKMNSCTEDGEKVYTCINCGHTYSETLKATGHNYRNTVVPATCSSQGYTEHTCQNCGHTYKDSFTPMTDHHYTDEEMQKAGCMNDGIVQHCCKDCGYTNFETVPKTGHDMEVTVVPATCSSQGYTEHTCQNCGYSYRDTYTKTVAHNYDDGVVTVKPTYTQSGLKVYTCQDCGAVRTETISPLEFDPLVNSSTIMSAAVMAGDEISFTASASGGTGKYSFAALYRYEDETNWKTVQGYSANTAISAVLTKAGEYQFCIKAKDTAGNISKKYFSVTVYAVEELSNTSVLSASAILKGKTVTVMLSSTGGVGTKQYAVLYKKSSSTSWTSAQAYSENTSVTIRPSTAQPYDIRIKVRDESGAMAVKDMKLTVYNTLKNTSTISSENITLGSSVTVNASAAGGLGSYTYAVLYKKASSSSWTKIQDYSSKNVITVKPKVSVSYDIYVKAKDENGTVSKKYFTVTVR